MQSVTQRFFFESLVFGTVPNVARNYELFTKILCLLPVLLSKTCLDGSIIEKHFQLRKLYVKNLNE